MSYPLHDLVGSSPAIADVIAFIGTIARVDGNVLLEGESGTGKELVARAIHRNSARRDGPFVALNCAALPDGTLENELFGHEKEAFTGAQTQRKGKFELANGGMLFMDEIGEMSWMVQAKVLRAVEYGEVQRMGGGVTPIHADVRVIAATNRNMRAAVADGDFREDLYYRLCVMPFRIPALRERPTDIPVLARHFISRSGDAVKRGVADISPEAERTLVNYDWPGNVRQLKHVIDWAVMVAAEERIQTRDLPKVVFEPPSFAEPKSLEEAAFRAKRQFVETMMQRGHHDFRKVAALLDSHPAGLSRLLDRLDLSHLKKSRRGLK